MRNDYKTLNKNSSELFLEMTWNQVFESPVVEELLNKIVWDYQIFDNDIWTAISGLYNQAKGRGNAHRDRANRINDDLSLVKARYDVWKMAFPSCTQG
jgi:hypothetical protein